MESLSNHVRPLPAVSAPNGYSRRVRAARNLVSRRKTRHANVLPPVNLNCPCDPAELCTDVLAVTLLEWHFVICWMLTCKNAIFAPLLWDRMTRAAAPSCWGVILCSFPDRQDSNSTICQKLQPIPVMYPHRPAVTAIIIETKAQRSF